MVSPTQAERFATLLRSFPTGRPAPSATQVGNERADGVVVEHLRLTTARDTAVPAILCRPAAPGPHPAVLYCHAHGNAYDIGARELLDGRPTVLDPPYGPLLATCGFVCLCVEMPTFGDRAAVLEDDLAPQRLAEDGTLMGDMLGELASGLDLLASRADVDADRMGAVGRSMGATHAYWLAALDPRVKAVAHLCVFADLRTLMATGAYALHRPYMRVPGLHDELDAGDIAAMVAPRPQLICVGDEDPLTPPAAFDRAWRTVAEAYAEAGCGEQLQRIVAVGSGHTETPAMRDAVLAFLRRSLKLARG